jgi:hypothetical protein
MFGSDFLAESFCATAAWQQEVIIRRAGSFFYNILFPAIYFICLINLLPVHEWLTLQRFHLPLRQLNLNL